jgi:hypothetical protein
MWAGAQGYAANLLTRGLNQQAVLCEISGSHGGEYEDAILLGYSAL